MRILPALLATCLMVVPPGAAAAIDRKVPSLKNNASGDDAATRAFAFLESLDRDRLVEKAYAERVLQEIDVVRASHLYEGDIRTGVDLLRLIALWTAQREKEAIAFADATLARGTTVPETYSIAFQVAAIHDPKKALDFLELADRNLVALDQRATFREALDDQIVSSAAQTLAIAKDQPNRARLAEGLLKFDWPGEAQFARHDYQRITALKGRLAKGDVAGASVLARQIAAPRVALELLVDKAYDRLGDGQDRVARLAALVATEDKRSLLAMEAKPADLKLVLERANFLRSVGRDKDALALLSPRSNDMAAVEKGGTDAFWLVNEQAFALSTLGRSDEAIALMRRLLALGVDKHPDLINMAINLGGIMNRAGRHREAAAYSEELFGRDASKASRYGQMWMWQVAACGHAMSGTAAAAKPWIERLRVDPDANRAALMLGLLCINDLDGAAVQLIERLNSGDASDMLVAVQNYTIALNSDQSRILDRRLQQVVARPAAAAAIASKGRILALPLSRTYWGMY